MVIQQSWDKYKLPLVWRLATTGFEEEMQPFNFIADYYGEKYAFYFAWLVHYTAQLLLPTFIGLVILIL